MVAKFVKVERRVRARAGAPPAGWQTVPNCERLPLHHISFAEALADASPGETKRVIFHLDFVAGVARGHRVVYMGQKFLIREVADSQKLRGVELRCVPIESPPSTK